MEFTIEAMKECHRETILAMMRTFYASPAVLTNGSEEIFAADIDACVSDNPYLEGFVFCCGEELLGYGMAAAASIPGNSIQGTVGLVLGLLLYGICKKQNLIK